MDEEDSSETEKEQKFKKLRRLLGGISEDYERGKQEFNEKNKPLNSFSLIERVCPIKLTENDEESENSKDSEDSNDEETGDSSSMTIGSEDESGAGEKDPDNVEKETEEATSKEEETDKCTLSDSELEETKSDQNSETFSVGWSIDSDESMNEKALFISSAANVRRRELHGQMR